MKKYENLYFLNQVEITLPAAVAQQAGVTNITAKLAFKIYLELAQQAWARSLNDHEMMNRSSTISQFSELRLILKIPLTHCLMNEFKIFF